MAEIMVVGPGAVGGVLACRWVEHGSAVALLGRTPASEAALIRAGLSFTGTTGTTRLIREGLLSARKQGRKPAAAFFCVKSHQTAAGNAGRTAGASCPV